MRFWHVAPASYTPGDDLMCWDQLVDRGVVADADWKWDEAPVGTDGHMVCLFADTEEGRQERDWLATDTPDGHVLRIDIDPNDEEIEIVRAEYEPYPAVRGTIPGRCITVER